MALTGWDENKKINIKFDNSVVDSDLTDFTVPVKISAESGKNNSNLSMVFDNLGNNFLKLAVEHGDTGNQCYVEVECWDSSTKFAILHVKVPAVSSSSQTEINLYYDVSHADNSDYVGVAGSAAAQNAWDSSSSVVNNFRNTPPADAKDSVDPAFDLTPYGSMDSSDLAVTEHGNGWVFNGSTQYALGSRVPIATDITIELFERATKNNSRRSDLASNYSSQDSGWIISMETDGKINFRGRNKTGVLLQTGFTANSYSDGGYHYIVASRIGGEWKIEVDITDSSASNLGTGDISGFDSDTSLCVAALKNGLNSPVDHTDSTIIFLRITAGARSAAWRKATHYALFDDILSYYPPYIGVATGIEQLYGAGPVDPAAISQVYGLLHDPAISALEQLYTLFYGETSNFINEIWGIELTVIMRQPYGNAPVARAILTQHYRDAVFARYGLSQRWADAAKLQAGLGHEWAIYAALVTGLAQTYSITIGEVLAGLAQIFNISALNTPINAALAQAWGLLGGAFAINQYAFEVTAGGVVLGSVTRVSITEDIDQYLIRAEISLADQAEYAIIQQNAQLEITVSGITYTLFVSEKSRSRGRDLENPELEYSFVGLSHTAGLDSPYGLPVTKEWPAGGMASGIVAELAAGFSVDWQLDDWLIMPGTLFANDEYPVEVIRRIIANRGVLQTTPAGVLQVLPEYRVSPPDWPSAPADYTLSELDDIWSSSESWDQREGINCVYLYNGDETDRQYFLEQEQLDADRYYLRGYRVPWASGFSLHHCGGDWVSVRGKGVVEEQYTEQVEFIDGVARVAKPVYAIASVAWLQTDLGAVAFEEDGSLSSETPANSLAEVTYSSKSQKWLVTDYQEESVQFWLQEDEA